MTTRQRTDRSDPAAARLTADQLATIDERQAHIREEVSLVLDEPTAVFALQGERHSRGWAGRQRLLGLVKVAIVDEGRSLLDAAFWRVIEYEVHIPWEVHYWEAVVEYPDHFDLHFHSTAKRPDYDRDFYRTVAPGHQTKEQLQYSQGHWLPTLVSGLPSIEGVGDDEALNFLGRAGLALDDEHPVAPPAQPTLALDEHMLSVIVGTAGNALVQAHGGLGPYRYEITSTGNEHTTITEKGLVLSIVPGDTATGIVTIDVRVTDVFGEMADGVLTLNIEPVPSE